MITVMIDIETLSTRQEAVIVEIGFALDSDALQVAKLWKPSLASNASAGRITDSATLDWWAETSRERLLGFECHTTELKDCLIEMAEIISSFPNTMEVWANSPSFDFRILANAYGSLGLKVPWTYEQERDLRTAKKMVEAKFPDVEWIRNDHNALKDAQNQMWDLAVCRAAIMVPKV